MENKIIEVIVKIAVYTCMVLAAAVTWLDRETRRGATEGDAS